MQTMDQFSHDLTLALEETSKGVFRGRWGPRRRTRSTGNLPCAPQPTEDSSSSPTDAPNEIQTNPNIVDGLNSMHSDSDDRHDLRLSFQKSRHNFESDSLNENFSPARFFRPNTRRKRKFKRMAVEYETTPSTPGPTTESFVPTAENTEITESGTLPIGANTSNSTVFPLTGAVKKRVLKHGSQENYRTNLFFCGKRKRSHRDHRYHDHHDYYGKQHSSSVPRQSHIFAPKNSFQEHKTRTRSFSSATKPNCDRILPLNKGLISKIEKISAQQQQSQPKIKSEAFSFKPINLNPVVKTSKDTTSTEAVKIFDSKNQRNVENVSSISGKHPTSLGLSKTNITSTTSVAILSQIPENVAIKCTSSSSTLTKKCGNYESNFQTIKLNSICAIPTLKSCSEVPTKSKSSAERRRRHKNHRLRRQQIRAQLQFDDPHSMECGDLNDFLSSSSLSSSDSAADETNESDREGDDELTDWPGNEAMVNFASKNDFKRKSTKKPLPLIKSSDDYAPGDDDTLMSGDEVLSPPGGIINFSLGLQMKPPMIQSQPITINSGTTMSFNPVGMGCFSNNSFGLSGHLSGDCGSGTTNFRFPVKQIESEMSGETSNPFLASPPCQPGEIREIRAGCRRIREERPGFIVKTSVNERLAKFLQDARQTCIRLPDLEVHELDSLSNLAKLYSLKMGNDNGCAVLTKTSNTTQSIKIDQPNFGHRFSLSDYKRRCYEAGSVGSCSLETNDSLIDCVINQKQRDSFENQISSEEISPNKSKKSQHIVS